MSIKELKKELGLKDKDLAYFFGLNHRSYSQSSAKERYEQAFVKIYEFSNKKIADNKKRYISIEKIKEMNWREFLFLKL